MTNVEICASCPRPLQASAAAEMTGLCDHCREVTVLERTDLANGEYRFKTGEFVKDEHEHKRRSLLGFLRSADPETCPCQDCVTARNDFNEDLY